MNIQSSGLSDSSGDIMSDFDEIRQHMELLNDEELLAIIRERDEEQWRPEVFDIVSSILRDRGVSPPSDDPITEEYISDAISSLGLVTVANYFNVIDAETDRLALDAKGLEAWILNKYSPGRLSMGGVELKVRAEDLTAAMAILESEPALSSDLPDDITEPSCPKCGSRDFTEKSEVMEVLSSSGTRSSKEVWLYHCSSCGYQWSEP